MGWMKDLQLAKQFIRAQGGIVGREPTDEELASAGDYDAARKALASQRQDSAEAADKEATK